MIVIKPHLCISLLFFLALPFRFISVSDAESQKWHPPTLITKSNLFRQASTIGFPDISFNFGSYFLKHFDKKCFGGGSESHAELVRQASNINKQVQEYVKNYLEDTELLRKIEEIGFLVNQANIIYTKLMNTKEVAVDTNFRKLHSIVKNFKKELLKESKPTENEVLFNKLISNMLSNARKEECGVHASSRAVATGLLISSLIAILQMARIELFLFKQTEHQEFWNEIKPSFNQEYMSYSADTVRAVARNGTKDTFACNFKLEDLKTAHHIYIGDVMAAEGKQVSFFFVLNPLFMKFIFKVWSLESDSLLKKTSFMCR